MTGLSVSVVVQVHDAERFLGDALRSALGQSRRPLEVIVVDDGSSDGSAALASSFDAVRVMMVPHAGPAAARNIGTGLARGTLIAFLDAEDVWEPAKLARQVEAMEREPAVQYSVTMFHYQPEAGEPLPAGFDPALLGRRLVGTVPSALVARRELLARIGGFDPALATGEDADWFARARKLGEPMVIVPELLMRKRVRAPGVAGPWRAETPRLRLHRDAEHDLR